MVDFTNVFLLVYAALFPIINPIGGAPLFLGLTADRGSFHSCARDTPT
jgi:multiple antibiotic resistance protein